MIRQIVDALPFSLALAGYVAGVVTGACGGVLLTLLALEHDA